MVVLNLWNFCQNEHWLHDVVHNNYYIHQFKTILLFFTVVLKLQSFWNSPTSARNTNDCVDYFRVSKNVAFSSHISYFSYLSFFMRKLCVLVDTGLLHISQFAQMLSIYILPWKPLKIPWKMFRLECFCTNHQQCKNLIRKEDVIQFQWSKFSFFMTSKNE